jgi:non-specific serine/threonine protein kinase
LRAAAALGAAVLLVLGACTDEAGAPSPPIGTDATSSTETTTPSTQAWKRILDAAPPARQEVAAAVVGGRAYVVGGLLANGASRRVEAFDPTDATWSRAPDLPIAIHHAMAAELNGSLVVMGGFAGDLGGAATDRVFILEDPAAADARWREGPRLRRPRGAGAAVMVNGRVILVGGISSGGHVAPVEIFDGRTWRDGAPIPSLRDHLAAATDGSIVYVAGGRRSGGHFGTFESYDPANDRWQKLAAMPTARSGLGGAVIGRAFVTVGGEGPRIFPEVEAYDLDAKTWRRLPDLAVPVHGVGVAALGTNLYAFVGGVRVGGAPSRVVQVLSLS